MYSLRLASTFALSILFIWKCLIRYARAYREFWNCIIFGFRKYARYAERNINDITETDDRAITSVRLKLVRLFRSRLGLATDVGGCYIRVVLTHCFQVP